MIELLARFLCRYTHGAPFRPYRGYYRCRVCMRAYPVPWGQMVSHRYQLGGTAVTARLRQQPPPPEVNADA